MAKINERERARVHHRFAKLTDPSIVEVAKAFFGPDFPDRVPTLKKGHHTGRHKGYLHALYVRQSGLWALPGYEPEHVTEGTTIIAFVARDCVSTPMAAWRDPQGIPIVAVNVKENPWPYPRNDASPS